MKSRSIHLVVLSTLGFVGTDSSLGLFGDLGLSANFCFCLMRSWPEDTDSWPSVQDLDVGPPKIGDE